MLTDVTRTVLANIPGQSYREPIASKVLDVAWDRPNYCSPLALTSLVR